MLTPDSPALPRSRGLLVHLQGHILLFDQKPASHHDSSAGTRLLFIVVVLEAVRLGAVKWSYGRVPLLIFVPLLFGLCVAVSPFWSRAEAVTDRAPSMAQMDCDGEVVFCPAVGYRERRFPASLRYSSADDSGTAVWPGNSAECLRSVLVLWLLPGGCIPRDAAVRARAPMGCVHRHSSQ